MKYILEDIRQKDGEQHKSFLIEGSRVAYVNERMKRLKFFRLNTDGFQLATGAIMNDYQIGNEINFDSFKQRIRELISKGCTTVVCYSEIAYEREFSKNIKRTRHNMINSAIDYVVGITIPLRILTPSLIRQCRREKVAIVRVNVDSYEKLNSIAWERIKDAMLSYQLIIIPDFNHLDKIYKRKEMMLGNWKALASYYKIPTYILFPEEHERFEKNLTMLMGLFPIKGELVVGSDVDYNLFDQNESIKDNAPKVVVLRGRVIKADDTIHYIPGYGREIKIKMPGQFVPIEMVYH